MLPRALDWLSRWRRRPAPPVRLYTKPDCPLCVEMKAELARARVRPPFRLEEVDVSADPALLARHGLSVPVLEIGGRVAFKGRLDAASFAAKYARRVAEFRAAGASPDPDAAGESRHG
jgi:hypothetical protein